MDWRSRGISPERAFLAAEILFDWRCKVGPLLSAVASPSAKQQVSVDDLLHPLWKLGEEWPEWRERLRFPVSEGAKLSDSEVGQGLRHWLSLAVEESFWDDRLAAQDPNEAWNRFAHRAQTLLSRLHLYDHGQWNAWRALSAAPYSLSLELDRLSEALFFAFQRRGEADSEERWQRALADCVAFGERFHLELVDSLVQAYLALA